MDTSTRLAGHGLLSEGRPHEWRQGDEEDSPGWHITDRWVHAGRAVCSCGEASPEPLDTNGARQRWHRDVHKPAVRARMTEAEVCWHCRKPIIRCTDLPPHGGCSSAVGWIHTDPEQWGHDCDPRTGPPYAEPEVQHG